MVQNSQDIGVILCDCGGEISDQINYDQLSSFLSGLHISTIKQHSALCSDAGRKEIQHMIETGINRIVIGACSPKLYEPLFRRCMKENGVNPFFLEMANLREQCAWAHDQTPAMNDKAQRLMNAAIVKAREAQDILQKTFPIEKAVLVIGGGIAGLQTAIDVADFGYKVHLIERAPVLGGNALRLGIAFPADDGAFCISSPDFLQGMRKCFYRAGLLQHPNLELRTLSQITAIKGSFGNFDVTVASEPRGVSEQRCINCGKCAKECPVETDNPLNYNLNKRKAIYLPHPNAVPPVYVIDWTDCTQCGKCVEICPTQAINLNDAKSEISLKVGAIVVATGFQEYDPTIIKQYGFGRYPDVITQLQLARILDPYGPFHGQLRRLSDDTLPTKIVMIQCVGSRDVAVNPYCSKICCTIALKHAIHLKEKWKSNIEIYVCYMDIRTLGKNYEDYFSKARELGIKFIRGKPAEITHDSKSGQLIVEVEDTFLNRLLEIEADMVVLSTGMVPSDGCSTLAETLAIEVDDNGFVKEIYPKLKPIETSTKGVYVCGGAQGPKDIPESITQAEATAFKVIHDLSKTQFEKELDVAFIEEGDCDGCELCVDTCPYHAIQMLNVKDKGLRSDTIALIDEIKCERCGSCVARCPTGAIQLRHHTNKQFIGQLEALLSPKPGSISPKIIAFCCNECGYATVDMAGMARLHYPPEVLPIRVPCLGWISPYKLFKALELGAQGLLLVGCLDGNCQKIKGNVYAEKIVTFTNDILDEIGLETLQSRIKITSVCAANPLDFSETAEYITNQVTELEKNKELTS